MDDFVKLPHHRVLRLEFDELVEYAKDYILHESLDTFAVPSYISREKLVEEAATLGLLEMLGVPDEPDTGEMTRAQQVVWDMSLQGEFDRLMEKID